jgi:hypothetical protein
MQNLANTRLKEVLGESHANLLTALTYGTKDKDLDLLLIFQNIKPKKSRIVDNLDLHQIEIQNFIERIKHWDPEYTDPIMTGEVITGDEIILTKTREFLETTKPTQEALDYLKKRGIETYLQADMYRTYGLYSIASQINSLPEQELTQILVEGEKQLPRNEEIQISLSLLTYTLSYLAFQQRYQNGGGITTLKQILDSPQTQLEINLEEIRRNYKDTSIIITGTNLEEYLSLAKNHLMETKCQEA